MQPPGWTKEDHAALLAAIQKTKLDFAKQKRAYQEDKIDGDEDTRKKQKIMGTEDPREDVKPGDEDGKEQKENSYPLSSSDLREAVFAH